MGQVLRFGMVLACCTAFAPLLYGQQGVRCRDRDYTGFLNNPLNVRTLVVRGELGVCSAPGGAMLVDLSDVLSPVVLSTFETAGLVRGYMFDGDRVFVSTSEEIRIVGIANPQEPEVLAVIPWGVWQITVNGNGLYASVATGELVLFDLSEVTDPIELNRWRPLDNVVDLEWVGDYLYTARSDGGIDIYDLGVWWNPMRVGSVDSEGSGGELRMDGQFAYVVGNSTFRAFDVADVERPVELGATSIPYLRQFVLEGTRLYVGAYDELAIYDISNPGTAVPIGWYDVERWPRGVALQGDQALVGRNSGGYWVLDVSDPKLPPRTATVPTAQNARSVARRGNMLCASLGVDGVNVVDLSEVWNPVSLASVDTPGVASDAAFAGDYLCVADMAGGIQVIDLSRADEPVIVGTFRTAGSAATVAAAGHTAFVGEMVSKSIDVVDISVPSKPRRVGVFSAPNRPLDLLAVDDLLYIADGAAGLLIVDVSVPAAPVLIGSVDTPGTAYGVCVDDGLAIVADGNGGVHVIDVHDPRDPELLATVETGGLAVAVACAGGVALVAEQPTRIEVVDFSDPESPTIVGWHPVGGHSDVSLIGNAAIVSGAPRALEIVDIGDCPRCPADFNADGFVDSRDIIAFLNAWAAGGSGGDFNGDGETNDADVTAYLFDWTAGC